MTSAGEGEEPSIWAELGRIREQLLRGAALTGGDLQVLTTTASRVGMNVPRRSRLKASFVERLMTQWKHGSRSTGWALIKANDAAKAGDLAQAVAILDSAIVALAQMPFYVEILEIEKDDLTKK